jgi:phospholipase C
MSQKQALLWLAPLLLAGCGGDDGPRSTLTPDEAAQMRQACAFGAGTQPGLSLAKDAPLGTQIPIDTVVIVMMENRSFDHALGNLPAYGQPDADVAAPDVTQPDPNGMPVQRFHETDYCFGDTNHGFEASHRQYNDGKMDGFVITNGLPYDTEDGIPDGTRAMGYYDEHDLPWLYAAANSFAISDRNFASVMGPTFPNREYLYAATSYGMTTNKIFTTGMRYNVMQLIEDHNAMPGADPVSWHVYYEGIPGLGIFIETLTAHLDNVGLLKDFYADAAAGTLANVTFVDPNLRDEWGGGDDFHPPGDMQRGEQWLAQVVDAVVHSPQWPHTALFVTFDEHGGIYDHVTPPKACAPDDIAPMVDPGQDPHDFAIYGFRVPLIAISPYAKPHYVSHVVSDHTSILRFVEARFKLPAMTRRDANADPLFDLFDFGKAALITPPSLPTPQVDQAKLDECMARFPLKGSDLGPAPSDGGVDG